MIYTSALTANKLFTHLFFQIWILMCTVPINLDEMVRFNILGLGRAVEFSRTPQTMVSSETTCRRWRQVRSTLLAVCTIRVQNDWGSFFLTAGSRFSSQNDRPTIVPAVLSRWVQCTWGISYNFGSSDVFLATYFVKNINHSAVCLLRGKYLRKLWHNWVHLTDPLTWYIHILFCHYFQRRAGQRQRSQASGFR